MIHPNAEKRPRYGVASGLASRIAQLFLPAGKLAAVPLGTRVYAIGDIHGCSQELDRLTATIIRDSEDWPGERQLIYMGDYVDRGPIPRASSIACSTRRKGSSSNTYAVTMIRHYSTF